MESPVLYFGVGLLACFLGSVPGGPINLVVVKTSVDRGSQAGLLMAMGASVVEIFQAIIAIFFGMLISEYLESNRYIKLGIAAAFIVLAAVMYLRRTNPQFQQDGPIVTRPAACFRRGLLAAALNPQAVPFWIFALAAISQYAEFVYAGAYLALFLVGVMVGKLAALYAYVLASGYIRQHLVSSCHAINKVLATVLLLIGISQLWNALA